MHQKQTQTQFIQVAWQNFLTAISDYTQNPDKINYSGLLSARDDLLLVNPDFEAEAIKITGQALELARSKMLKN